MKNYDSMTVEDMMKKAKQMASQTDKDLDDLIKNDPELRNLHKKNSLDIDNDLDCGFANSDDELDALENEVKGIKPTKKSAKPAKKGKSDSDKALENIDLEDEHETKNEVKPIPKSEENVKVSSKPAEVKKIEVPIPAVKEEEKATIDVYPVNIEKMFHKHDNYSCMGVLSDEVDLMSRIIEYKKKNCFEPNHFENKIVLLNVVSDKIRNLIENELITLDIYKSNIESQKGYENSILEALSKKKETFDPQVYEKIVERIKKRIELIDAELSEQILEIEPEEVQQLDSQKEIVSEIVDNNPKEEVKAEKENSPVDDNDNDKALANEKSVITKVKAEPVKEEPKIVIDTELIDRCKKKFELYKSANKYFVDNGFTDQAQDAANKASLIFKEIQKLLKGEQIDEFGLPIDITPDYINGCTRKERAEKYMSIAKDFVERKNKLNESLKDVSEKLKLLDKREIDKNAEQIKKMINDKKQKIENYDKIIKKIIELSKNQWVPPPLFSLGQEDEKIEVINSDIPQYCLKLSIGKNNYLKDGSYINLIIPISEKRTHTEVINPKKIDDYQFSSLIKLEKSEFNSIFRKSIEIQVFKKR